MASEVFDSEFLMSEVIDTELLGLSSVLFLDSGVGFGLVPVGFGTSGLVESVAFEDDLAIRSFLLGGYSKWDSSETAVTVQTLDKSSVKIEMTTCSDSISEIKMFSFVSIFKINY